MNVLLYSLIFPPDVCSNAFVFADLATELKKLGNSVSVITTTPHYDVTSSREKRDALSYGKTNWYRVSQYEGMKVYHIEVAPEKGGIKQRLKTFFRFHFYASKLLKRENIKADIVLSQTPPMTVGWVGNRLAKKLNAKSVFILQDLWLDSMIGKGKVKTPIKQILRRIELNEYKNADAVCTIADAMAEVVRPRMAEGKLHIIPNFVNTDIYHPTNAKEEMKKKYGVSQNDFVVSYVGNVGNAQDLMPVIDYAKRHQGGNFKVLIAGNGIKYDAYKGFVEQERINNIKFLGFVTREETTIINTISNACLVMLAKHVVSTSFPSKTYTIMAMAKPIIITCSNGSVAGKFIEENKIGWAVDSSNQKNFDDLLNTIISDPEMLTAYGQNAYELVMREYSKSVIGKKYNDMCIGLFE